MKDYLLILLVIVMLLPVDKLGAIAQQATAVSSVQLDDQAIEGEFAMQVNNSSTSSEPAKPDAKPDQPDKPKPVNCTCNGTGMVKSGDGIIDVPCPCGSNCQCNGSTPDKKVTCQCGCGRTDCKCGMAAGCNVKAEQPKVEVQAQPQTTYFTYYFSARWCGPCASWKIIEKPKLEKIDKTTGKPKWQFGKDEWKDGDNVVEVDGDLRQDLVKMYEVDAYPAFVVVKNGKKLAKRQGYVNDIDFANWHNDTINKDKGVK